MTKTKLFAMLLFITVHFSFIQCQSFEPDEYYERYITQFRDFRKNLFRWLGRTSENTENLRLARKMHKLQDVVPPDVPFPCNVTGFRSPKRPSSVNMLRPGDIDIIGAIGDSLTAGYGLAGTNLLQIFMENRGLSWSIGGQGTWRQYVTLPNILKEFNPNLFGYSLRDSYAYSRDSQFNPAEGAAISSELPYQTKILIQRIKNDRRVNMKEHWKLITVAIGPNDFCLDTCFKDNLTEALDNHKKDMIAIFRLLRDNLPRTFVNFVKTPQLRALVNLKGVPQLCQFTRRIECYCLFSEQHISKREIYYNYITKWQQVDEEVTKMPEFHTNDFEVAYQPALGSVDVPKVTPEQTDFTYMAPDCFHLSQKFNAEVGNTLWNNMLQRVGSKTHGITPLFKPLLCPTEENPYIFTTTNSRY